MLVIKVIGIKQLKHLKLLIQAQGFTIGKIHFHNLEVLDKQHITI